MTAPRMLLPAILTSLALPVKNSKLVPVALGTAIVVEASPMPLGPMLIDSLPTITVVGLIPGPTLIVVPLITTSVASMENVSPSAVICERVDLALMPLGLRKRVWPPITSVESGADTPKEYVEPLIKA